MNHHYIKKYFCAIFRLFLEGNDPKKKPYSMMMHKFIKNVS